MHLLAEHLRLELGREPFEFLGSPRCEGSSGTDRSAASQTHLKAPPAVDTRPSGTTQRIVRDRARRRRVPIEIMRPRELPENKMPPQVLPAKEATLPELAERVQGSAILIRCQ